MPLNMQIEAIFFFINHVLCKQCNDARHVPSFFFRSSLPCCYWTLKLYTNHKEQDPHGSKNAYDTDQICRED